MAKGTNRTIPSWLGLAISLGFLTAVVMLANGVPPVGSWVGWLADQIADDSGWGKFLIALLTGVISALVAVLTVRLTDRSSRTRAQLAESQRAAEALTRALANAWHDAVNVGAKPDDVHAASMRFNNEQLVQRAVLTDEALREQVLVANAAFRDWATLLQAASRRSREELDTDPITGEVIGPDFERSKGDARATAQLQVQRLGEELTGHRQGKEVDRRGRHSYLQVELVDARASASNDVPWTPEEQPADGG